MVLRYEGRTDDESGEALAKLIEIVNTEIGEERIGDTPHDVTIDGKTDIKDHRFNFNDVDREVIALAIEDAYDFKFTRGYMPKDFNELVSYITTHRRRS